MPITSVLRPIGLALAACLLASSAAALPFAEPFQVDRIEFFARTDFASVDEFDEPYIFDDGSGSNFTICGNAVVAGNGFLEILGTDNLSFDACPGKNRFRLLLGDFARGAFLGSRFSATFTDVAPAEGESIAVSLAILGPSFVPVDFVRFEVRRVGGQLFYGALDENGSVGFTNTLDFSESLTLEVTVLGDPVELRYGVDGGPLVDVTAELAVGPVAFSGEALFPTIEAALLPAVPASPLLLLAGGAFGACRRRQP